MQEPRVGRNTAARLKEAGFDWYVNGYFLANSSVIRHEESSNFNQMVDYTSAPTLSHAAMWLREVKGVNVIIVPIDVWAKWSYRLHFNSVPPQKHPYPNRPPDFTTHTLAESAGLDAALDWVEQNEISRTE